MTAPAFVAIPEMLCAFAEHLVWHSPTPLHLIRRGDHRRAEECRRVRQVFEAALAATSFCGRWVVREDVARVFELFYHAHPQSLGYCYKHAWRGAGFRAALRAAHDPGWASDVLRASEAVDMIDGPLAVRVLLLAALPPLPDPPALPDPTEELVAAQVEAV